MSTASPASKAQNPDYSPISVLNTDTARLYTHIHPVIVLSIYFLNFKRVVAHPVSALAALLLPLAISQIAYVIVCLPPIGSADLVGKIKSSGAGKGKKIKGRSDVTLAQKIAPAIIALLLSLFLFLPIHLFAAVLLGAPFTTHIPHTILLSAHLALLSALPVIYTRGISASVWRSAAALLLPVDETWGASLGVCIGAWLGAVPIPLDWDRDWQKWPITIVTGAYIGWAVGRLAGVSLLRGKIVDLRP